MRLSGDDVIDAEDMPGQATGLGLDLAFLGRKCLHVEEKAGWKIGRLEELWIFGIPQERRGHVRGALSALLVNAEKEKGRGRETGGKSGAN